MTSVSGSIVLNPPDSLEVLFLGSLPNIDKRSDSESFAFPLAYYEGSKNIPEDTVYAPISSIESTNKSSLEYTDLLLVTGYAVNNISSQTSLTLPSYSGLVTYTSKYYDKQANDSNYIRLNKFSSKIDILSVTENSVSSWEVELKNGLIYKDITVTQAELDHTNAPISGATSDQAYSGSWLKAAGFIAGDKLRLIYTIPNDTLLYEENSTGSYIDYLGKIYEISRFSQGYHGENGLISLEDRDILYINRLSEISVNHQSNIFNNVSISGNIVSTSYSISSWNGEEGFFKLLPPPEKGAALSADYVKEKKHVMYNGFYDDQAQLWQSLDLNPADGHYFNNGVDRGSRASVSGSQLIYRQVTLYLLPVAALRLTSTGDVKYPIRYYSAYVEGGKDYKWSPLRHYVLPSTRGTSLETTAAKAISSWGYASYDVNQYVDTMDVSATDRGIPCSQDSAVLLSRIRIQPKNNIELKDARRFSGLSGIYDKKEPVYKSTINYNRWDITPWENLTAPLSSVVLFEIDHSVIASKGLDFITQVINKHMPPGAVPIIKEKQ